MQSQKATPANSKQIELGMSWGVFINFFFAAILSLLVPIGLHWGPAKLLGVFAGLSAVAVITVFLFVPSTNEVASLEDMNYVFGTSLKKHSTTQMKKLVPSEKKLRKTPFFERKSQATVTRTRSRNGANEANDGNGIFVQDYTLGEAPP